MYKGMRFSYISSLKRTAGLCCLLLALGGCGKAGSPSAAGAPADTLAVPAFSADSAYAYIERQCAFGPRVPGSEAHRACGDYLVRAFTDMGLTVTEQRATCPAFDGTPLPVRNVIASLAPGKKDRVLLCAHWDSRPWADNDPEEKNRRNPVTGANDGASGVAVLMEMARQLAGATLAVGVDFICFDAEDYGMPDWEKTGDEAAEARSWCIGSQYWAAHPHRDGYRPRFGILLDMVGGQGARFYQEGLSLHFARSVVANVWDAARRIGYGDFFVQKEGGFVTDDHLPLNRTAGIPTIDIIAYYPDCEQSNFGPTWHTVDDVPARIDRSVLKAVGQTVLQVIYETK